jgi:hypothetical protein
MFYGLMNRLKADGVQVKQIRGTWLDGDGSVNYDMFRQLRSGASPMTPQQAAFSTWTGQQAKSFGYTNITKLLDYDTEVKVWFSKPNE